MKWVMSIGSFTILGSYSSEAQLYISENLKNLLLICLTTLHALIQLQQNATSDINPPLLQEFFGENAQSSLKGLFTSSQPWRENSPLLNTIMVASNS
jgi:hypothetical protein